MKIAYFGYNAFSSCLDMLIQNGHEIVAVFTGEQSQFSDSIIRLAQQHQLPLVFDKPEQLQIEQLIDAGVELFLSAEYPWKIPLHKDLPYAVNLHPSMLPEGRGAAPLPRLLLGNAEHAGITLHKMTGQFDQGDILLQQSILLATNESYDTLSAKLYVEAPYLLNELLKNLEQYYQNARPQLNGSQWQNLSRAEQTVNWQNSTADILKQIRAFGSLGVYAQLAEHHYLITMAEGVAFKHQYLPGELVLIDQIRLVIACSDGLISMPRNGLLAINP